MAEYLDIKRTRIALLHAKVTTMAAINGAKLQMVLNGHTVVENNKSPVFKKDDFDKIYAELLELENDVANYRSHW